MFSSVNYQPERIPNPLGDGSLKGPVRTVLILTKTGRLSHCRQHCSLAEISDSTGGERELNCSVLSSLLADCGCHMTCWIKPQLPLLLCQEGWLLPTVSWNKHLPIKMSSRAFYHSNGKRKEGSEPGAGCMEGAYGWPLPSGTLPSGTLPPRTLPPSTLPLRSVSQW